MATDQRAWLLLTFTTLCWGLNAVISRLAVGEIAPMQLVCLRWVGVIVLLAPFAGRELIANWPKLRAHSRYLILMASSGFTAFNALFYLAAYHTSAINIGILQGSIPILVLLASRFVYREMIGVTQLMGVIITLAGVVTVTSRGHLSELSALAFNHGDLLMLLACAFYAAYSIGLRSRPKGIGTLQLFSLMAIAAWLTSLPLLAIETWHEGWQTPTPTGVLLAAIVALLPSLVAQLFFIQGVALIGPERAGVFVNLVPVFAAILAVGLLGEHFHSWHALALSLVLGGIALSEFGKRASRQAKTAND